MGMCGSKDNMSPEERQRDKAQRLRSRELEKDLKKDHAKDMAVNKLLLLGAGESGKSTLFKQMTSIYGKGFAEADRKTYIKVIYNNILQSMKTLCEMTDTLKNEHGVENTEVAARLDQSKQYILEMKLNEDISPELAVHIAELWKDPGIQQTYKHRAMYQLTDSASYFFGRVKEVADPAYIPTQQDVLRSRVRTTGIVEERFEIDRNRFVMFDVGGQRNERKKWMHCFEDVTAVIFVTALSGYNMRLFEDESTNRLTESLNLFDEICNSAWFTKTAMILMLNKRDLFQEKIEEIPLTEWDEDLPPNFPANDYDACTKFIAAKFEGKRKDKSKQIYTHITCATDEGNMRVVFNAVKDIVIRKSLQEGGLLV